LAYLPRKGGLRELQTHGAQVPGSEKLGTTPNGEEQCPCGPKFSRLQEGESQLR